MPRAKHRRKSLTSVLLVAAALVAAAGSPRAQDGMGVSVRSGARASAVAQAQRTRQAEQRQRMERAGAHARMPSTMYASTPSPTTPPHPFPLDVDTQRAGEHSVATAPAKASASATARSGQRIPLFAPASDIRRQGFARIINHSDKAGEVRIDAYDDAGTQHGPVILTIGAGETVHFNSNDLETGNPDKGLSGATGPGEGDWRLELTSALDLEVLAYVRTRDGFLTSMHDLAPETETGHRVTIFNPGRNVTQVSWLRLINLGSETAEVRIEGIDGNGEPSRDAVELSVPAGASRTLTAQQLESGQGAGVRGALGTGSGKWRLVVSSAQAIEVMSLLSSPTGHLTNLSTVPGNAESDEAGATTVHTVPLVPSASSFTREGVQGFVRVINHTDAAGEVRIEAFDDAGIHPGPVTLDIDANETVHFNSGDLEEGNPDKGLSGGIGAGTGAWRLRLSSSLDLQVLAYIRTEDGFLTSMHDLVPETEAGHRVAVFNPGRNVDQVSRLRLINPGAEAAEVRIEGIDGGGESPGGAVELSLAAGASRTLTAQQLESGQGAGVRGALGTGSGKWQLVVTSEPAIEVMSLLSSPTGHLTNLSTAPGTAADAAQVFREHISGPVVQSKCVNCHVEGGLSGNTRLVFVPSSSPEHEARNLQTFKDFLTEVEDGASYILNKIRGGLGHGGGTPVAAGTVDYAHMERFLGLLGGDISPVTITPQTLFETVQMAPARKVLRRAAIVFAGRTPTDEEYAAAQGGAAALRATIRGLMTGPQFHEFLIRASNDRLLTDRNDVTINGNAGFFVDYTNERYRRRMAAYAIGGERGRQEYGDWNDRLMHGFRRAPLELIAHVVENDLPYTEILTADYIMANPWAAKAYGASTRFDDPEDVHEFKPSRIVSYYRQGEGYRSEFDPALGALRVLDPGPLSTDYPHAGILNTTVFLKRYPTTATNRNRARSRWTYYHFLGLDIEKSASRTTDPVALADTNSPTLYNPACTVCHRVLDPVAGAFQNYGDEGLYRDQWGGLDSLDGFYKDDVGTALAIRSDSWRDRETLSWPVSLAAGVETLKVVFTNPFHDHSTSDHGQVYLDRLRVADAGGRVIISREFEDLEPPIGPWGGPCGDTRYNPATGRDDHLWLHWGDNGCAILIDVEVPSNGIYDVEIVAWADRHEQYGEDGFAKLAVAANPYREGDTWYRDMRAPGFNGDLSPNPDNSVQWLARQIVADERFAEATVKFWWPAIMGSEVAEPPEDEGDAEFEGRLLAANAQDMEVQRLASEFRRGFQGRAAYNLKDLLVEIVLSKWFRARAVDDADPVRSVALRDAGATRLLTPEELARKTGAITGVQWGRHIRANCWPECKRRPSALTEDYRLLYGGIDSDGVTERARDVTAVMAGIAKRQAVQVSCLVVMREFYLLPEADRRLFAGIDQYVTPASGSGVIRNTLVELHKELLGVQVTPHSPDVEAAYRLFVDVMERGRESRDDWFDPWQCYWWRDHFVFEGILDDAVVEYENEDGYRWYGFDNDRVNDFLGGIDWSDPHYTTQTWRVVLAYLMTDYRYLYL